MLENQHMKTTTCMLKEKAQPKMMKTSSRPEQQLQHGHPLNSTRLHICSRIVQLTNGIWGKEEKDKQDGAPSAPQASPVSENFGSVSPLCLLLP